MIENYTSHAAFDPIPEAQSVEKATRSRNPLDSTKSRDLHQKLTEWWKQAKEIESTNRYQQSIDADFKDGLQWTNDDIEELQSRGQAPLVYNRIKPAVDWILGTEKRSRFDFKVQARKPDDANAAEAKTGLLKYLSDVNRTAFARSRAFDDAVTVGIGWLEDGIRGDTEDEPIYSRYESWRNMWYDPLSVERDLSDSRYIFRSKFVDLDIAKAMFPSRARSIEMAAVNDTNLNGSNDIDDFYATWAQQRDPHGNILPRYVAPSTGYVFNNRQRVRLIECWYREPVNKKIVRGGQFHGQTYDSSDPAIEQTVTDGVASVYDALVMQMKCAVMTQHNLLQVMDSPYAHNKFPFTPVWGFRRSRDNAPYGVVRNIRDPQENLNKRMSKALHILSTNQIIADEDAATDWDDIRDEAARPDGIILLDGRREARFEMNVDKSLAAQHIDLMNIDKEMIQDVSGITSELLGQETNAVSGKAVNARQEQGSIITTELFDNLRYAMQVQGEKQLSMVEQFYSHEKVIRVIGDSNEPDFQTLNQPVFDEINGQVYIENDIVSSRADFIIDETEYRATQRRAMFDAFNELFKALDPQVTMNLLDLMFEYSDLPGREEVVSRIRKLNGQSSPNAKNDPEEQARLQQQAEAEQQQQQMMQDQAQATLDKLRAEVEDKKADAINKRIEALYSAMQAAAVVAQTPAVASIADSLAASAGYEDANGAPLTETPAEASLVPQQRFENVRIDMPPPLKKPASPGVGAKQGIETPANDATPQKPNLQPR